MFLSYTYSNDVSSSASASYPSSSSDILSLLYSIDASALSTLIQRFSDFDVGYAKSASGRFESISVYAPIVFVLYIQIDWHSTPPFPSEAKYQLSYLSRSRDEKMKIRDAFREREREDRSGLNIEYSKYLLFVTTASDIYT